MNRLYIVGMLMMSAATPAAAQDRWDALTVHTGALIAQLGSTLRFDPQAGQFGTSIDLEKDLGFQTSTTTFFADGTWRLSRRNQLQFSYYNIRRNVGNEVINRDITFDSVMFTAQAQIDAHVNTAYFTANYGFNFVANPNWEVGVMIGLTALRIDTGMAFSGQVGSNPANSRQLSESVQFTAPIPLPGLYVNYRVNDRVTINGFARYLKISVGDFGGEMGEARAGVDVKLWRWLGIGGTYYGNRLGADYNGNVFNGRVVFRFNGPEAYALLAF